jgi:hypothetical protein
LHLNLHLNQLLHLLLLKSTKMTLMSLKLQFRLRRRPMLLLPLLLLFKLLPLLKVLSPLSTMPKMSSVTSSTATATPNRPNLNKETLMEM